MRKLGDGLSKDERQSLYVFSADVNKRIFRHAAEVLATAIDAVERLEQAAGDLREIRRVNERLNILRAALRVLGEM